MQATFLDENAALAQQKRHCTVGDALRVARDMRARSTVLTHVSQRYVHVSATATVSGREAQWCVAFDGMDWTLRDTAALHAGRTIGALSALARASVHRPAAGAEAAATAELVSSSDDDRPTKRARHE